MKEVFAIPAVGALIYRIKDNKLNILVQERYKEIFITSLKIDKHTKMGIIGDLKEKLREINALKINYITKEGTPSILSD